MYIKVLVMKTKILKLKFIFIETNNYLLVNNDTRTRGSHSFKYGVPKTTKDVFKFSFFPHTIREWNLLPEEIVSSKNLFWFRNNIAYTGVCTTEYHATTEYQFFYLTYKIGGKRDRNCVFIDIYQFYS